MKKIRALTKSGTGTWGLGDARTWDSGTQGLGAVGTQGRGDSGLRDAQEFEDGLEDFINKQHMTFALNLYSTIFVG